MRGIDLDQPHIARHSQADDGMVVRGTGAGVLAAWFPPRETANLQDHRDTLSAIATLGSAALETARDVERLQTENLLLREGDGFKIAMMTLDRTRPGIGAQALGIAQGALDLAVSYAKQRKQFGRPIADNQGIQFMLADMATKVEAARLLVYNVAEMIASGEKNFSKYSAMAKMFASDRAMEVTNDAIQILGGYGYMKEYPAERMMRDAKITQIYEGTNQIQRLVIARDLLM